MVAACGDRIGAFVGKGDCVRAVPAGRHRSKETTLRFSVEGKLWRLFDAELARAAARRPAAAFFQLGLEAGPCCPWDQQRPEALTRKRHSSRG